MAASAVVHQEGGSSVDAGVAAAVAGKKAGVSSLTPTLTHACILSILSPQPTYVCALSTFLSLMEQATDYLALALAAEVSAQSTFDESTDAEDGGALVAGTGTYNLCVA
jgi:hypothetical protein